MLEPAPDEPVHRDPTTCPAPSPGSGFTDFLVEDPDSGEVSREELREAIRSLIRERDYLRNIRDYQQIDHAAELARHCAHEQELAQECEALRADRDAWSKRAAHAEMGLPRRILQRVRLGLIQLKRRIRSAIGPR